MSIEIVNKMSLAALSAVLALALVPQVADCIQVNVGVDHDVSGPTYGLEGKTASQVHYDDRNGLALKGTIGDILGPPIKIASGFSNMLKGSNLAGLGSSLKSGGALLGFDAKLLETAGAGNLLKGGLLLNGASIKSNLAGQVAGTKGQKIANIIEVPVKVVAMKDLAAGKVLTGLAQVKQAEAQALGSKGQLLFNQGNTMKTQGLNQVIQGTNEGVQNIGNMVQKTAENVNTAFRLLPIVWDMHQQQMIQQHEEATKNQQPMQQQHLVSTPYQMQPGGSLTGGSLFGGLSSLMPGLNTNSLTNSGSIGSGLAPNPGYAAIWNSTSPLTNLLMNPAANPFLFPLAQGPLGQAFVAKQPIGTQQAAHDGAKGGQTPGGQQVFDFNLIPGLRYKESVSSQLPVWSIEKSSGPSQNLASKEPVQQQVQAKTK